MCTATIEQTHRSAELTTKPRLQWGFLNAETGIAVIYDMEADLIATVFKPVEGALFFDRQIGTVKIERKEWNV